MMFEATDTADPADNLLCDKADAINQAGRNKQAHNRTATGGSAVKVT